MTEKDLEVLTENVNRTVRIVCKDGEQIIARIVVVSEEDEDVIYELLSTNRNSNYEKFDEKPGGYLVPFKEIESVEALGVPGKVIEADGTS